MTAWCSGQRNRRSRVRISSRCTVNCTENNAILFFVTYVFTIITVCNWVKYLCKQTILCGILLYIYVVNLTQSMT
jgi:hypothetical protein